MRLRIPRTAISHGALALILLSAASCGQSGGPDRAGRAPTGPSSLQASATRGSRPALSRVRIVPVTTPQPDGKTRFKLTGLVADRDNDVLGGQLRVRLISLGNQVLVGVIQAPPVTAPLEADESTTADAKLPGRLENVTTDERNEVNGIISLDTRPRTPLKAAVAVQDNAGNRSTEVTATSPIPPPTGVARFDGRYTGTARDSDGNTTSFSMTVSNGRISVSGPGFSGSGSVNENGGAAFGGVTGTGFSCSFSGQFSGNSASGTFRCTGGGPTATGIWTARRVG